MFFKEFVKENPCFGSRNAAEITSRIKLKSIFVAYSTQNLGILALLCLKHIVPQFGEVLLKLEGEIP